MHKVKCYYCGEYFDRDKEPFELVTSRRYAHKYCYDQQYNHDEKYEELIYYYLSKEVFINLGIDLGTSWYQMLKRQLNKYIKDDQFTYEGIYNALRYHYSIRKGDPTKSNGRIGIVPYVYDEAQAFYLKQEQKAANTLKAYSEFRANAIDQPAVIVPQSESKKPQLIDMNSIFESEDDEC